MLAGLAWLGGLISMISESLGELLTTMRVGPIVVGPRIDEKLDDIPEGSNFHTTMTSPNSFFRCGDA